MIWHERYADNKIAALLSLWVFTLFVVADAAAPAIVFFLVISPLFFFFTYAVSELILSHSPYPNRRIVCYKHAVYVFYVAYILWMLLFANP